MNDRGRWMRYAAWGIGVVAVVYLAWSLWDRDAVTQWLRQARPLPFFALMALLPLIGFPITPFFILAGGIFGTLLGVLGSLSALGLNLIGCYAIAKKLRPGIEGILRRFGYRLPDFASREKGAIGFTAAVKVAPGVPAFVKNYGIVLAGVGFVPYFVLSLLTTGLYGVAVIMLGDSLFDRDRGRILILVILLAVLVRVAWWWWRRSARERAADLRPS